MGRIGPVRLLFMHEMFGWERTFLKDQYFSFGIETLHISISSFSEWNHFGLKPVLYLDFNPSFFSKVTLKDKRRWEPDWKLNCERVFSLANQTQVFLIFKCCDGFPESDETVRVLARRVLLPWVILQVLQVCRCCELQLLLALKSQHQQRCAEFPLLLYEDAAVNFFAWLVAEFILFKRNKNLSICEVVPFDLLSTTQIVLHWTCCREWR